MLTTVWSDLDIDRRTGEPESPSCRGAHLSTRATLPFFLQSSCTTPKVVGKKNMVTIPRVSERRMTVLAGTSSSLPEPNHFLHFLRTTVGGG